MAQIHSAQALVTKSDDERKAEILLENKWVGPVRTDGNCLIASLLEGLVYEAGLLPEEVLTNRLTYDVLCADCRHALITLPVGHELKPVLRDIETGAVRFDAADEEHDRAYLQCDLHSEFIIHFFLNRYNMEMPAVGLRIVEYCRFDHIRGGPSSTIYANANVPALAANPVSLGVYNSTGDGICGYHYEPVFAQRAVPPPPPVAAESRPPAKRNRTISCVNYNTERFESVTNVGSRMKEKPATDNSMFYRVRTLTSEGKHEHDDLREVFDNALKLVVEHIRENPTLPSGSKDATNADADALREDAAILLPRKHCAFIGCDYTCESDDELIRHLQDAAFAWA